MNYMYEHILTCTELFVLLSTGRNRHCNPTMVFHLKTRNALLTDISDSLYVSLNGNWTDSQRYVQPIQLEGWYVRFNSRFRFSGDLRPLMPMVIVSGRNELAPISEGKRGFKIGYYVTRVRLITYMEDISGQI